MDRVDVIDLLTEIKENYSTFDVSDESIDRHYKYLHDFPFTAALQNVEDHVKTSRFAPLIADIRGKLGDQLDSQRSKEEAEAYLARIELWKQNAVPPPDGMRERVFSVCRGTANDNHG